MGFLVWCKKILPGIQHEARRLAGVFEQEGAEETGVLEGQLCFLCFLLLNCAFIVRYSSVRGLETPQNTQRLLHDKTRGQRKSRGVSG
jgi:hypothetical protein